MVRAARVGSADERPAGRAAVVLPLIVWGALAALTLALGGGAREAEAQSAAPSGKVVAWGSNLGGESDVPGAAQFGVIAVAGSTAWL